jgi:coenzyme F420-0:L-glutamate ligase / coenzyme F420-1:gamma-L-glutamate ligase
VASFTVRSLTGLPEVRRGDDLAALILGAVEVGAQADSDAQASAGGGRARPGAALLGDDHIVVVAQKAVSKAEGATVALADVRPGAQALEIAAAAAAHGQEKDPRAVQVVLDQSAEVVRSERGVLICRTHTGLVCANAGVDASNAAEPETLIVLPADPDASARRLRTRLHELSGARPGVIVTDSFGRAWRNGQCDTAIGCAGVQPLEDWRGRADSVGRELSATLIAVADAISAGADLARTKDSREPVVIVEGLGRLVTDEDGPGVAALVRAREDDLFR